MGSRFRFFGAGVAVSALCFLLASMTWQYVLGMFVLVGVGCGFWTWLTEAEKEREKMRAERKARLDKSRRTQSAEITFDAGNSAQKNAVTLELPQISESSQRSERPSARRRAAATTAPASRARRNGNVYQFPAKRTTPDSSSRSEAAD